MASEGSKDAGVNVEVAVRCRPLNGQEKSEGTPAVVSVSQSKGEISVAQNFGAKRGAKKFKFDKAFGQYATQSEVFDSVVVPIIDEVLTGFNCTVFAYGQTGTGKTHTMEGDMNDEDMAGIIPRAINKIFAHLDSTQSEYSVRVSFLELYNEQLEDLLAGTSAPDKTAAGAGAGAGTTNGGNSNRLRLVEDARQGVVCQNLEEVLVHNSKEVFQAVRTAIDKRKVAETKMNEASSRSHCIFTLKIHMKETTPDGEDLLKVGKLNLVDLAGSECVGRSGARNQRAREAKNINKSLLTLGRVITALTEGGGHVPYRDSKLTRLLQESLGGRAKTCIIATLSPSVLCVEESLSTLDYAHRAKNIRNKPQVNQKLTKRALIKEYSVEIEKLRAELQAQRTKDNGVFLAQETFDRMEMQIAGQGNTLTELESVLATKSAELKEIQALFKVSQAELESVRAEVLATREELAETSTKLEETSEELKTTTVELEETSVVLTANETVAKTLRGQADQLHSSLQASTADVSGLWAKIGRKTAVEQANEHSLAAFQDTIAAAFSSFSEQHSSFCDSQLERHQQLQSTMQAFMQSSSTDMAAMQQHLADTAVACSSFVEGAATDFEAASTSDAASRAKAGEAAQSGSAATRAASEQGQAAIVQTLGQLSTQVAAMQQQMAGFASLFREVSRANVQELRNYTEAHEQQLTGMTQAVQEHLKEASFALSTQQQAMDEFEARQRATRQTASAALMSNISELLTNFVQEQDASTSSGIQSFKSSLEASKQQLAGMEAKVSAEAAQVGSAMVDWVQERDAAAQTAEQRAELAVQEFEGTASFAATTIEESEAASAANSKAVAAAVASTEAAVTAELEAGRASMASFFAGAGRSFAKHGADMQQAHDTSVGHIEAAIKSAAGVVGEAEGLASTLSQDVTSSAETTAAWSQQQVQFVQQFTTEDFSRDKPTGTTPAKRGYPAPGSIASPPMRQRVLAAYRAGNMHEIAHAEPEAEDPVDDEEGEVEQGAEEAEQEEQAFEAGEEKVEDAGALAPVTTEDVAVDFDDASSAAESTTPSADSVCSETTTTTTTEGETEAEAGVDAENLAAAVVAKAATGGKRRSSRIPRAKTPRTRRSTRLLGDSNRA